MRTIKCKASQYPVALHNEQCQDNTMPLEQVVTGDRWTVVAAVVQRKRPSLITDTSVALIMRIGLNPIGTIAMQPNAMHYARGMLRNGRRRGARGLARPRLQGGKTCHANTSN